MTEVQKNWHKNEIKVKNVKKSRKYKSVEDAWKKFKSFEIDYDDFEDILIGFEDDEKITSKQRESYQDKAEEIVRKNDSEFEKEFRPSFTAKEKTGMALKRAVKEIKRK